MRKEYAEGKQAYFAGQLIDSCPYKDIDRRGAWNDGWRKGRELSTMDRGRNCRNCKWWDKRTGGIEGECHGGPPTANSRQTIIWPVTQATDWCGSFEMKPKGTET